MTKFQRAAVLAAGLTVFTLSGDAHALSVPKASVVSGQSFLFGRPLSRKCSTLSATTSTASTSGGEPPLSAVEAKKLALKKQIRAEGGPFAFNTKYGALNPYGIYYGLVSIVLGIAWLVALLGVQLLYAITGNRFDKMLRLPIFFSHIWGVLSMVLTGSWPKFENTELLKEFFKKKKAAMFVANHNSWMDIPFLGASIGWRNYKIVAKAELGKVPILGKSIKLGGHVMVDRTDRRSQLRTFKAGMQWLKDGVHLCTFPEGTRSRSGRLQKFKNGAFKMAHKRGAPIVPISIVGSAKCMPSHFMFPIRPARGVCKVIIHKPIESEGKTEEELVEAVKASIISGLPEEQRPAKG